MSGQWFFAMVGIFLSVIPAVIYLVAAWLITHNVPVTAGTIVAFTTVQARVTFPLMGLLRVALDLQTSQALFARIFEYLDLHPAIVDRPDARPVGCGEGRHGRVRRRGVPLSGCGRRHSRDAQVDVVHDRAGPVCGVRRPIGRGQDDRLVPGPALPRRRARLACVFAGEDVRDLRQDSLVRNIGIVSQETYLFHATIAENLRYAKPDATDAELEAAARAANIHDTIVTFPLGYDTVVGERGYRLSGGEKQRVAIARVLLKDPPVLILDEATSALDTISERIVQSALDEASRGRTTIAIAHRLSTVIGADVIFVVQGGEIVETGTHTSLLAAGGEYSRLFAEQAGTLSAS